MAYSKLFNAGDDYYLNAWDLEGLYGWPPFRRNDDWGDGDEDEWTEAELLDGPGEDEVEDL